MFEQFTERSRKVMALANQEAQRWNHEYIGTEHILLGFIKEGEGRGAHIIKSYGIDLKKLRSDIEKVMKIGPDIVTIGKLPQTPRAKQVVEYAIEYARDLGSNSVGTEHFLYGLIVEEEGIAAQILMNNGLDEGKIKKGLEDLVGVGSQSEEVQEIQKPVDYWKISKSKMDIRKFLESYNYVIGTKEHSDAPYVSILVGEEKIGRLFDDPKEQPLINYNPKNLEQLNQALVLGELFDKNEVKYQQIPSASEVVKQLKEYIKDTTSLITRLEKRV